MVMQKGVKKEITILIVSILFCSIFILPLVLGNDIGDGIGVNIETEDFEPRLWMCDHRKVIDDDLEPGREQCTHITVELGTSGDGVAEISGMNAVSGSSARLFSPLITSTTNEARVKFTFPNGFALSDLDSISWKAFVDQGYAPHVDVRFDIEGDGIEDDSLVFEYAKVDPNDCDDALDYPLGNINTFADKGIVDEEAYAWLNSGPPGPCGDATFDANHMSLEDWKTNYPNALITAIEIEVDGWISTSEAFIDNVLFNGLRVENFNNPLSTSCIPIIDLDVYSSKIETCEIEWEACVTSCVQGAESECHSENDGPIECSEQESEALGCVTACVEATFKVTGDPDEDIRLTEIVADLKDLFGNHDFIDRRAFRRLLTRLVRLKDSCQILKGQELVERSQNYAFEGEKLEWIVLAMDKNKIEEVTDVTVVVGDGGSGGFVTVQESQTFCGDIPLRTLSWNDNINLSMFDTTLGSLTGVSLYLNSTIISNASAENLDASPSDINISIDATSLMEPDFNGQIQLDITFSEIFSATAYDGVTDFGGTSGVNFPDLNESGSDIVVASNVTLYEGSSGENFTINVSVSGTSSATGPSNVFQLITTSASAEACVTYTYENEEFVPGDSNIEAECVRLNGYAAPGERLDDSCNARIDEEELEQFDDQTMAYYECTITVEPSQSMYGEQFIGIQAEDLFGNIVLVDELEFWFFNPIISLFVSDPSLDFGIVRPGTISYSNTIIVGNDADIGSGVLLDMFISGTDFYDLSPGGARCVISNRLRLGNNFDASRSKSRDNTCDIGFNDGNDHFCYFASNGAYSTITDPRSDAEGYAPIIYGNSFSQDFYNDAEIIFDGGGPALGPYSPGNLISPGDEISLTFKLGLPEPCVGNFDSGDIFFWGEAI